MHLDVGPVSRLRGADRVNVMALLAPVVDTICDDAIDLSRISVICDWVQYRANFREVADIRPVLSTGWPGSADPEGEQCNGADGPGRPAEAALDEFVTLSAAHGRDYYRRLQYLMGDYSPHVLGRALKAVVHHSDHVTALVVDATHPAVSLGFLRGKAFLAYVSNVYDNLPSDELVRIGGRTYRVEVRAYLPGADVQHIAAGISAPPDWLPDIVSKLLRLGPELLCEAMPSTSTAPSVPLCSGGRCGPRWTPPAISGCT
jgi:hypothetical protein